MTALSIQDWASYLAWMVITAIIVLVIIKDCEDNGRNL